MSLELGVEGATTDEVVVPLAAALTTNTSMEEMVLNWSSTRPDDTLKKMAECVSKSNLREVELYIYKPSENDVEVQEWYQRVEVYRWERVCSSTREQSTQESST